MVTEETSKPKIVITRKNLRRVAGLNGFTISELARKLGMQRATIYDCVSFPTRWPGPFAKVDQTLKIRSLPHE